LHKKSEDPALWEDRDAAQATLKELSDLTSEITLWNSLKKKAMDARELAEMDDPAIFAELDSELVSLEENLLHHELDAILSDPYDRGNALLTVFSGAGGTDSQDWASMLLRMYLKYAERKGYKTEILDQTDGDEAGIKSATLSVDGDYAYGYLKAEKGVHRLVRLSPFDSNHRRHTSFAQVEILPDSENTNVEIQIHEDDIRIDVFRSSGAGGQNVQKNATAVRLTHIPTNIVVTCQNERSQLQNRENAMRVLRAKLLELQREEQEKKLAELKGEFVKTEWGSQIRSYVLHPYQMVKDHRTEFEMGNAQGVLDGDLDGFIEAYLKRTGV
jgi:peptide chain release factor 2